MSGDRQPGRRLWCLLALVACGPTSREPAASYESFTLAFENLAPEQQVRPGQRLLYRVSYRGDLARNLRVTAVLTHLETGESEEAQTESFPLQDSRSFEERRSWWVHSEFLKQPGPIRIQLKARVTATLTGSEPWWVESEGVVVSTHPRIDSLEVQPGGGPIPYGSPITVVVSGADLFEPVQVTVEDLDSGQQLPALELLLPFDGTQSTQALPWTIRSAGLERIGLHRLQLTARFGRVVAKSLPFELQVTHTLDGVTLLLADASGTLTLPSGEPRLDQVQELVIRISGTQLAGHELALGDEPAFVAAGDEIELRRTPTATDFEPGKGTRRYDYLVRSGMERSVSVTLRRWNFESCEWTLESGQRLENGQQVASGTVARLRARGWGFPDTQTLLFLKRHLAKFTIWERDAGRSSGNPPQPLVNNDDQVDTFDAEIHSSQTELDWTVRFVEEAEFLYLQRAELYFEVRMEDALCTSGEIAVPEPR